MAPIPAVQIHAEHDEEADILEIWIGDAPRAAVSIEGSNGVLTRVAINDGRVCGFTIFDWSVQVARRGAP